jgi:hypothetical protein
MYSSAEPVEVVDSMAATGSCDEADADDDSSASWSVFLKQNAVRATNPMGAMVEVHKVAFAPDLLLVLVRDHGHLSSDPKYQGNSSNVSGSSGPGLHLSLGLPEEQW